MSIPKEAKAVKLIASILITDENKLSEVLKQLTDQFGDADYLSPLMPFFYTDYYRREMGSPIERMFVAFQALVRPESLPDIKLWTNGLERKLSGDGGRRANIDPGYLSAGNLILATGKGYAHRPYLRNGIYADLTLMYAKKCFQVLPWTYPDYAEQKTRDMLMKIRAKYILQLKMNASYADA
jgi:hypothetical protein